MSQEDKLSAASASHPATRKHLIGTQWTARAEASLEFKHWHVVALSKDGIVTLAASLSSPSRIEIAWRQLRDRDRWVPGWD